ncbi:MAG: alpha-2-macroglobulin, partial [Deltaproteobacteria bacterium]|nr:alpha-2-macroglobulin [Deltaproteobacteria bacterium]
LYVNPVILTGPDGTATVEVPLADSITEWRVSSLAHTASGKLGGGTGGITVFQDFFVDVGFPATLTRGDEIEFPIAVYNYLEQAQTVSLSLDPGTWYTPLGATTLDVTLAPGEVRGVRFPVRVEEVGDQALTVRALGTARSDAVERRVRVVPDGKAFPRSQSGSLGSGSVTLPVDFPIGAVPGSEQLYLTIFPGFLSQLVQGMDSLFQVPSGCFEQTTSTTWPNVLALDYMTATKQITPDVQLKADSYINAGYQRLLTFEHPGGGFSWFGTQDPAPYLSVTAFGLMEFADMAKVATVDAAMVERTRAWLAAQQKPDGSWPGDQTEFFSFHTSGVRNTAFVVWALGAGGYTGPEVSRGLDYVKGALGAEATDPYTLGLVANAFEVAAPADPFGASVLDDLEALKKTDGTKMYWDTGGTQTDFYGSGNDGAVATTGIITHAMLLDGGRPTTVGGALEYLAAAKDPAGNFGSTQATIWTLKSLVLAAARGTETATGALSVSVDGAPFSTVPLLASQPGVMTTVDLSTLATAGSHQVTLGFAGQGKLTYGLVDSHHLPWADAPPDVGPLAVSVAYDKTQLRVNETAVATVTVSNTTGSTTNMILVTVGIPPGFAISTDDLDAYKASGTLSQYELTDRQLTLYLTELAPGAADVFSYRLVATMPVKADDGGASASLYYEPERRVTAAARQLVVTDG